MESLIAAGLATEARLMWHHYTTSVPAEAYLARSSPAHPEEGVVPALEDHDDKISPFPLLDHTPPLSTDHTHFISDGVLDEWEIVDMTAVVNGGVACEQEKILAECLVHELQCRLWGVAADSALTRFLERSVGGCGQMDNINASTQDIEKEGGATPDLTPPPPPEEGGATPDLTPPPPPEEGGDILDLTPPPPPEEGGDTLDLIPPPPPEEGGDTPDLTPPPPPEEGGDTLDLTPPPPPEEGGDTPDLTTHPPEEGGDTPDLTPPPPPEEGGDTPDLTTPPPPEEGGDTPDLTPPPPPEEGGDTPDLTPPPPPEEGGDTPDLTSPPPPEEGGDTLDLTPPPPTEEGGDTPDLTPPPPTEEGDTPDLTPPEEGGATPDLTMSPPGDMALPPPLEGGDITHPVSGASTPEEGGTILDLTPPPLVPTSDACTNTPEEGGATLYLTPPSPIPTSDVSTNTLLLREDRGTSPAPAPPPPQINHAHSQTILSNKDLLDRVKEGEEFQMLKVDFHMAQSSLNKERSQRLVAEELVKIIQSDLNALTERNMTEVMTRVQMENELTETKGELSHCTRQLKEREERIQELVDTLKGTTIMVRKLEEQNATTLINRGGIDYMLQARLADGRAKEAEQKLQVIQAELLQSQNEVRMLLDRVTESSRDRAEMVSSKVHNQLMTIADERVAASERRGHMMERELLEVKGRLSLYEKGGGVPGGHPQQQHGLGYSGGLTSLPSSGYGLSGLGSLGGSGLTGLGSGLTSYGSGLTSYGSGLTSFGGGLTGLGGAGAGGLSSLYNPYSLPSSLPPPSLYATPTLGSHVTTSPLQDLYNLPPPTTTVATIPPSTLTTPSLSASLLAGGVDPGVESTSHDFKLKSHDELTGFTAGAGGRDASPNLPSFNMTVSSSDHTPLVSTGNHGDSHAPLMSNGNHGDSHAPLMSNGNHDDSDNSSEWSSSDDEEDKKDGDGMRPSTHTSLIAEWEWRAMNKDAANDTETSGLPPITRKVPPPVAPKPVHLHQALTEPSISFEKPSHPAVLRQLGLKKPQGPSGRKLPSRWQQTFTFS